MVGAGVPVGTPPTVPPVEDIACPDCGEVDRLRGRPDTEGTIRLECLSCGTAWHRDTRRRCRLCGSKDLRYTPKPLWERGRGDQRTPAGRIDAYACNTCGGRDVTSGSPRTGRP